MMPNKIKNKTILVLMLFIMSTLVFAHGDYCKNAQISVQVLGSGGPELIKDRASSGYLVWHNDKAILMFDAGGGTSLRFAQSQAKWKDLKAIAFSHFHADHSNAFPALVKASWFGERQRDLPIFGPYGNDLMPATTAWLKTLFASGTGTYKYLSDFYQTQQSSSYLLKAHDLKNNTNKQTIFSSEGLQIIAQQVKHGPIPAFAYLINICGKNIVFSGDTNGQGLETFENIQADLFVAHNAVPETAGSIAKSLHMTPSTIGKIAALLGTKKLVLSHRMNRSLGKEKETKNHISKNYTGPIVFADDLDSFTIQ